MDDGDGWWCFPLPAPKQQCVANIFRAPEAAKVLITVRHFTWNQEEVVGDGVCGQKLFAIIMDAKIVTKFKLFSFILVFSGWGAREMLPLLVLCWLFCLWLRWWNLIYRQSCFRLLVCIYFSILRHSKFNRVTLPSPRPNKVKHFAQCTAPTLQNHVSVVWLCGDCTSFFTVNFGQPFEYFT